MLAASTTIPAVKAAVFDMLSAAAKEGEPLAGVTIARGMEPERAKEYVWVFRAEADREFKGVGGSPVPLDEDVSVRIRVVAIGGDDPEARVFEIVALVEQVQRADVRLAGAVKWSRIQKLDEEPQLFDVKPGHHVWLTLTARARI